MSDILKAMQDASRALHDVGAMDKVTMRRVDLLALSEPRAFTAEEVKAVREQLNVSQPVFAKIMGVSKSVVSQWETGRKRPGGPALRLLEVLERQGVEAAPPASGA